MDFEVEGRHEEVQKERERVAEWTLKWREMRGSPKGASKSGGMDFEVERRQEEVQKERERVAEWTLKWRGDARKSKKSEKEWQIGL